MIESVFAGAPLIPSFRRLLEEGTSKLPDFAYLGIDPGASGCIVVFEKGYESNRTARNIFPLEGKSERDIWDWVRCYSPVQARPAMTDKMTEVFAIMEKVGGFIPGSKGNIGSRMFQFGKSYGILKAFLVAAEIPYEEVSPSVWQPKMGIQPRKKGEAKPAYKNRLRVKAQMLFPNINVTADNADGLLIAEYCRRLREGLLK